MKKFIICMALLLAHNGVLLAQKPNASTEKTGSEWHAAGDAIPRSQAFANRMKKELFLDDATSKKVFQAYLANTKSVDEIKMSTSNESAKKAALQNNLDTFNDTMKGILTDDKYRKYIALNLRE